jgi:hypothetical protein
MANVISEIDFPYSANKASVAKTTPSPVAASLPNEPPRSYRPNVSNQFLESWMLNYHFVYKKTMIVHKKK